MNEAIHKCRRSGRFRIPFVPLALLIGAASPATAEGWVGEDHGAKAAALGQAFVAQADDPTAVSYNPAGLAFLEDRAFAAGISLGLTSSNRFVGFDPIPGAGRFGEREIEPRPVPHVYWVEPVATRWAVGLGVRRGAGFESTWKQPDTWSGRFEARDARLDAWDLTPVAAVRIHQRWALSAGVVARWTTFSWTRDESEVNPASQAEESIGISRLDSSGEVGWGAVLGVLYRPPGRWSLGLRWRSEISVDIGGSATYVQLLSGDPAFDALAATLRPFGQPATWDATLRFPERTVLGVAFSVSPTALLELDIDRSSWDSLNAATFTIAGQPLLDRVPFSGWRSRTAGRIGLRWNGLGNGEWRAGLSIDPTPQPDSNLGPFFVGADRFAASIGFGTRVQRLQTDLAVVWEEHERRSTTSHGFDGRYTTRLLRLVLTFGW